jgi:hypothetical protein
MPAAPANPTMLELYAAVPIRMPMDNGSRPRRPLAAPIKGDPTAAPRDMRPPASCSAWVLNGIRPFNMEVCWAAFMPAMASAAVKNGMA